MTGLDTNVLVRYIMQDDPKQASLATQLVESLTAEAPGFVAVVALVELVWVLSSCFGLGREEIARALDGVLRSKELVVENAGLVWQSLRIFRSGAADFADCVVERAANTAGCARVMTFDRGAAKHGGMTLIA